MRISFLTPANTVGSTLWKIHDDATASLMTSLYGHLKNGDNVARALRKAQLQALGNEKLKPPYFWAAFKITGRVQNPFVDH